MPFFLDSNVIIGYIFYNSDNWGNASINVFGNIESKHSGETVNKECFGDGGYRPGNVRSLNKYISGALRSIIFRIKNKDSIKQILNEEEDERILNIIKDTIDISEKFPNKPIESLFRTFLTNFEKEVIIRKNFVNNECTWHNCSLPYKEIYNALSTCISDKDDIEVLINAHHVAQTISDLTFISGDNEHVILNTEEILSQTNIFNIVPLWDFS